MTVEIERKKLKLNIVLYILGLAAGIALFSYFWIGLSHEGFYPGWWGAGVIVAEIIIFISLVVDFAYLHESITQYIEL